MQMEGCFYHVQVLNNSRENENKLLNRDLYMMTISFESKSFINFILLNKTTMRPPLFTTNEIIIYLLTSSSTVL